MNEVDYGLTAEEWRTIACDENDVELSPAEEAWLARIEEEEKRLKAMELAQGFDF